MDAAYRSSSLFYFLFSQIHYFNYILRYCFFVDREQIIKAIYRDIAAVSAATLLLFFIARHFNLSERLFLWSRMWEEYQADELLFPLIGFSIGLIWFSYRRYKEAHIASFKSTTLLSENRQLMRDLIDTQERERLFLAQELHDVFAQYLTALRSQADLMLVINADDGETIHNTAQQINNTVAKLHHVTRSLLKNLRPPLLDFGVAIAIEDLVTEWQKSNPQIKCQFTFQGDELKLNKEELLTLYRSIQEGLSNISKHTKASHVDVALSFNSKSTHFPASVSLQIINNGDTSIDIHKQNSGLGLIGIRERVSILNGDFDIHPHYDEGTCLSLSFCLGGDEE